MAQRLRGSADERLLSRALAQPVGSIFILACRHYCPECAHHAPTRPHARNRPLWSTKDVEKVEFSDSPRMSPSFIGIIALSVPIMLPRHPTRATDRCRQPSRILVFQLPHCTRTHPTPTLDTRHLHLRTVRTVSTTGPPPLRSSGGGGAETACNERHCDAAPVIVGDGPSRRCSATRAHSRQRQRQQQLRRLREQSKTPRELNRTKDIHTVNQKALMQELEGHSQCATKVKRSFEKKVCDACVS
jgi:hypothetical protein